MPLAAKPRQAVALWVPGPYASRPLRWYFLPGLEIALHFFNGRLLDAL